MSGSSTCGSAADSRPVPANCCNLEIACGARLAALLQDEVRRLGLFGSRPRAPRPPCAGLRRRASARSSPASTARRASASCRCSSSTLAPTVSRSTSSRAAASSASMRPPRTPLRAAADRRAPRSRGRAAVAARAAPGAARGPLARAGPACRDSDPVPFRRRAARRAIQAGAGRRHPRRSCSRTALQRLFGLAAAHIRFGQPFAGETRGAGAGGGGQVSAAQRLVGGRLAPFVVGLLAIQRKLLRHGLHARPVRRPVAPGDRQSRPAAARGPRRGPHGRYRRLPACPRRRPGRRDESGRRRRPRLRCRSGRHPRRRCRTAGARRYRPATAQPAGTVACSQSASDGAGAGRSSDLRVVQRRAVVAGLKATVRRDPGVEQPGGFERGFEAGALRGSHRVAKIHQLPERRALTRRPGRRRRACRAAAAPCRRRLPGVRVRLRAPRVPPPAPAAGRRAPRDAAPGERLACCCADCSSCRAGLSPCSVTTHSASGRQRRDLPSGSTCNCFRPTKWLSQLSDQVPALAFDLGIGLRRDVRQPLRLRRAARPGSARRCAWTASARATSAWRRRSSAICSRRPANECAKLGAAPCRKHAASARPARQPPTRRAGCRHAGWRCPPHRRASALSRRRSANARSACSHAARGASGLLGAAPAAAGRLARPPRRHLCIACRRAAASFSALSRRLASCIVGSARKVSSRARARVSATSASS